MNPVPRRHGLAVATMLAVSASIGAANYRESLINCPVEDDAPRSVHKMFRGARGGSHGGGSQRQRRKRFWQKNHR